MSSKPKGKTTPSKGKTTTAKAGLQAPSRIQKTETTKTEKKQQLKILKEAAEAEEKTQLEEKAQKAKEVITYIGSKPFPVEHDPSNFIETMVKYPACASLIFIGHGGPYTEFNLTNPCLIPFYVLSLFTSYSSGFSTFSRTAHCLPEDLRCHRMGKTLALNNVHVLLEKNNANLPLTIKSLFKAMENDPGIKNLNSYHHRAMVAEYKLILEGAKAAGRDSNKVGHYAGGNNSNQILVLCLGHMYNNSIVHDNFCGLFLKLYYYKTLGIEIWSSSMNDNYNPESPATKNSIKFLQEPRKLKPVSEIAGQPNTVYPEVTKALLADLSSIEVLNKVRGMTKPLLNLLMKILIARNVLFVSSCSGIPNETLKSKIDVKRVKITYDYLSLESVLSTALCEISPATETAPATFKTLGDDETKIYQLTTEDTFFLMHFLSIISNQEIPQNGRTLERIQTIMDQLSRAITSLLEQTKLRLNPMPKPIYERETLILTTLSIRLMNDSIMSNAYYTRRVMGFIQSACRPANRPEEETIVKKATPFSQEITKQLSNDDEYDMFLQAIEPTSIPKTTDENICEPLQPIEQKSIPETMLNNAFLLAEMNKRLDLPIPEYLVGNFGSDEDNFSRNDANMDMFIRTMVQRNLEVSKDYSELKMSGEELEEGELKMSGEEPEHMNHDAIELERNEILTMFKTFDNQNKIHNVTLSNIIEKYNYAETTPLSLIEEAPAQVQLKVGYGGRNKNKTHRRSKRRNRRSKRRNRRSKRKQ